MKISDNLIIPRITRSIRNEHVLGYAEVPQSFYSLRNTTYSEDFRNLLEHSSRLIQDNARKDETTLRVLRSKHLDSSILNDQHIIKTLNETSIFNEYIINYKNKIKKIIESGSFNHQFFELKDVSQDLTDCLLKTLYYVKGTAGIDWLNDSLLKMTFNGSFNPDCLKLYNIIIYSAPFVLMDAANGCSFSQLSFFYSPYELICNHLHSYVQAFVFEDLTFLLKLQLRLEQNIPEIQSIMNLYKTIIKFYAYGRNAGIITIVVIPTLGLMKYLPLLYGESPSDTNSIVSLQHESLPSTGDEYSDIIINILIDILMNQY